MRVSVIIVSYNTRQLLRECLEALGTEFEVIVVDNASRDGSADLVREEFPHVILIENTVNRGFGAANNQGLAVMTGDLALLLNSDARPDPGAIHALAAVFEPNSDENPVIAAGGALHFPDGRLQQSACRELTLWAVFCEQFLLEKLFPNSKIFSPYWVSSRLQMLGPGPHEVEQVMGACLMFRPVEKFNEDFFLYTEDTDLCKRLHQHGKILYVPTAKFIHHLGASSESTRWESVARYNRGKELYFELHHGKIAAQICLTLNRAGALLRVLMSLPIVLLTFGRTSRKKFEIFKRVLFAPISGPPLPPDSLPKP